MRILGMVGHFRPIVLAEEIAVLSVLLSWKTSYDRANPQSRLSWVLVLNVRRHISATTRILRQLTAIPSYGYNSAQSACVRLGFCTSLSNSLSRPTQGRHRMKKKAAEKGKQTTAKPKGNS